MPNLLFSKIKTSIPKSTFLLLTFNFTSTRNVSLPCSQRVDVADTFYYILAREMADCPGSCLFLLTEHYTSPFKQKLGCYKKLMLLCFMNTNYNTYKIPDLVWSKPKIL